MFNKILLLVVIGIIDNVFGENGACPDDYPIKSPCHYYASDAPFCDIICDGDQDFNIYAVFADLNQILPIDKKPFRKLILRSTGAFELPHNAFAGIQFQNIIIEDCSKLKYVEITAFDGTISTVTQFTISNSQIKNSDSDFCAAISTLKALEILMVENAGVITLPSMCVSGLKKLREIGFYNNPLKSISTSAFNYLPSLKYLHFNGSPIQNVSAHAFTIGRNTIDQLVDIYFYSQPNNPFDNHALQSIGCATNIGFWSNSINYLDSTIFELFLTENTMNKIFDESIDCADSRNQWIREKYPHIWTDLKCRSCPNDYPIKSPCEYRDGRDFCDILCSGNNLFDVYALFSDLNNSLPTDKKQFRRLELTNKAIEELPANAFGGIQFSEVYINESSKLQRINTAAFNGTASKITILQIDNSPINIIAKNDLDWFGAINTLNKLEKLHLSNTKLITLTSMSLSKLNNLRIISFSNNPLQSISRSAFNNLLSLELLEFKNSPIERVAEQAFTINCKNVNENLEIDFDTQPNDPFANRAFESIGCATTIHFGPKSIKYLNRDNFDEFFSENINNKVLDESIDCVDKRNQWIKEKHPHVWHDLQCKNYITCPNDYSIKSELGSCAYMDYDTLCNIACWGDKAFDIKALFFDLNHRLPNDKKTFWKLEISNTAIEELPANAFAGIQFKQIHIINASSLHRISPAAFEGTASITNGLFIKNTTITELATNDSDLFGAINALPELAGLELDRTGVTTLPTMSVTGLKNLEKVTFKANSLKSIYSDAFSNLPMLQHLQFIESPIQRVFDRAFTIKCDRNVSPRLVIDFDTQREDPFDNRALESIGCSTTITLRKGSFKYLDRNEFEVFFSEHVSNRVNDKSIDCYDSRNQWVKEKFPDVWKDWVLNICE